MPAGLGRWAVLACALAAGACAPPSRGAPDGGRAPDRPNIVLILIDDLGWADVGCFGSSFYETPNIDRLAAQGVRFTQGYAACTVCSPTRASVLTGKYPARLRLTNWIPGHARPWARLRIPDWTQHLPLEEVTLAEALKPAGYAAASIGKWHLGGEGFAPEKQGFDLNVGGDHHAQPPSYFSPYHIPKIADGPDGEYLTDRLTAEAERFIEHNKSRPFFLYLPHYAVHSPIQAKPELVRKYKARARPGQPQNNAAYAAMIESMDESVGRILRKLDQAGVAGRTVVVFASDNGGQLRTTSNAPLREGKGSPYEGGHRVPTIIRWPGVVKPGSACDVPVMSIDFYPTFLEMAGVGRDPGRDVDGVSFVSLLAGTGGLARDALYWHYPHYHPGGASPYGAVRKGDFKLIEFYEDGRLELYNLQDDLGETRDLASAMPEKAAALREDLRAWRQSVAAQMPTPNPDYAPEKAGLGADSAREKRKP